MAASMPGISFSLSIISLQALQPGLLKKSRVQSAFMPWRL